MLTPILRNLAAHQLASQFMVDLADEIGKNHFLMACMRNKSAAPGICHSHDFCDANMVMHAAFCRSFGNPPGDSDMADDELWNEAWKLATAFMATLG